MDVTIGALQEMGAFAGPPVQKVVEWEQNGEQMKITAYVRKLSYRSIASDIKLVNGSGDIVAGRIASCICDEKGQPVFTVADITGEANPERGPLNYNLTMALLSAISEVNSMGKSTA